MTVSLSMLDAADIFWTRFPNGIQVEGSEMLTSPPKDETEDDFFESWSKPATPKASAPGTRASTPPVMGRTQSSTSSNGSTSTTSPPAPSTTVPRTITSSSVTARPSRIGGTARLNSGSTASSTSAAPKKSKLGLGAAKAKAVNFEEAERRAKEEEERIKQLGYDRRREEEEEKARKEAESLKKANEIGPSKSSNTSITTVEAKESFNAAQKSPAFPRLGFGAIPGAGAAVAVAASATTAKRHVIYF